MDKKRLVINLSAQMISIFVSLGIGFVLTPYIVNQIGEAAYSYVKISNDFVSYAQILVSALNTMASRFITINIHQKNYKEANKYFSSVFFSNIIISAVLVVPSVILVLFLDNLLDIESGLVADVKLLFFFIFLNFFISIIASIFSVATYAKDRLDLLAIKMIQTELIRAAILLVSYVFFRPYLWYTGVASIVCTIFLAFANRKFTKRLLPEIKVSTKDFDVGKIWELVSLGLWNSITRLGQVLLEQLDVLIANIFISGAAGGLLAIAKTIPGMISSNFMGGIIGIFNPQITIAYAKGNKEELVQVIKSCNRMLIFLLSIPLAFLTAYGMEFYQLWMPKKDTKALFELTILTIGTLYVSMSIQVLYHVFIITKRVKENAIVMLLSGMMTTLIVFILLKNTNLGIYAVAGVSTAIGLLRNLTFTPMFAAKSLGVKWYRFYSDIGLGFVSIGSIVILGVLSKMLIPIDSWFRLFAVGIPTGVLALVVNYFIILTRTEREILAEKVKNALGNIKKS
ncbi:lipopolysaccharide biosynthesis protein [Konateibacter massiliensis]|uniref:lipopolysaccharide biosynthesis protein n=1 Tax=Konateibacter massiliensis TaxID=2002841 RepID=UPI000C16215A|nr:oligosaccharide flippase family protein [Konateibacter massiliensis]